MYNIKECFRSRWDRGVIIEIDFSQLEVVGAAVISKDPMMAKDIIDGVDSHSQSASWLHPEYSYEEIREKYLAGDGFFTKMRKNAKAPRFELQYGAGAKSIARNNKLPIETAKGFIQRYYDRYAVLKSYQDSMIEQVEGNRTPSDYRKQGIPLAVSKVQSPTGRIYTFTEEIAPAWMQERGVMSSFSPTQIKNYPIQGFSTGDVVLHMLGHLLKVLGNTSLSWFKPIGTIHDSILFDVDTTHNGLCSPAEMLETAKQELERTPQIISEWFDVDFNLPLSVDIELGRSWDNVQPWDGSSLCNYLTNK